jgi:hypothetical protein
MHSAIQEEPLMTKERLRIRNQAQESLKTEDLNRARALEELKSTSTLDSNFSMQHPVSPKILPDAYSQNFDEP